MTIGMDLAKKFHENDLVINAIGAHHGDIEPKTVEAVLVQAADAISAARPGARRESLETYIKRLEKLESIAYAFDGVETCYAIQSGREVRIIVKPEDVNDAGTLVLAREIAKRIEKEMEYPGQIKVNVIRETDRGICKIMIVAEFAPSLHPQVYWFLRNPRHKICKDIFCSRNGFLREKSPRRTNKPKS